MEFRVLGLTIEARTDASTSQILDLGGVKQQRVLAALLLAKGNVVSNDRLIDAVWGEQPPAKPNVTLRSYVSHLRRVLEPEREAGERARRIVTRAPGYAVVVEPAELDCWQFELEVAEANDALVAGEHSTALSTAERALARWSNDDLSAGVLEPFDAEVHRLDDLRRRGRRVVHEALLAMGRHDEALPSLEAALRQDPFDEGIRGQLMVALYRAGRQADALACFVEGRQRLLDELGLDASPELRDLELRILSNDPLLDWVPSHEGEVEPAAGSPSLPAPAGREVEAAELVSLIDRTADSAGGVVIVTGEPGIGKSTLLRHGIEAALARGMAVAVGRCHDGSSDTTLFPWITAWRALVERLEPDELEFVIGPNARWLSQILPEIGERLGVEPEPSSDRYTLFEVVGRTLRHGSTIQPVCIVLEDLHWADESSIRLLSVLAESLVDVPVVILASWRDTEAVSDEVATLLADLSPKSAVRFALGGLSTAAVEQILADDSHGDPRDAERLASRTGGNPLFLNELLRSKQLTGRMASSDTVREAINSRLRRLPAGASTSLAVGALCPDGFSETLVAKVLVVDDDEVLDQFEAALAARMIEEDPAHGDRFRFTHDLFAETLIDGLSKPRRARFHTRLGLALENGQTPVGELAHHFLHGAGDESALKGAEYAHRAAVVALSLFDYDGAARLLAAGLQAIADQPDEDALRADLLIDQMQVLKHQERYLDVHEVGVQAFDAAHRASDIRRMAITALRLNGSSEPHIGNPMSWLGYWSPPGLTRPMLEICAEKLPENDALLPSVLSALGNQHLGSIEDPEAPRRFSDRAIEAARSIGGRQDLAYAIQRRHDLLQRELSLGERHEMLGEALDLLGAEPSPLLDVQLRRARAIMALDEGDPIRADREIAMAEERALESGIVIAVMNAEVGRVGLLLLQGHTAEVEARLNRAFERFERFGSAMLDQFGLQLSALMRAQGRHAEVVPMLEWKLSGYPGAAFSAPLAAVLAEHGDTERARSVIDQFDRADHTNPGEGVLQFMTPMFFADAAYELEDRALADALVPVLMPARGRIIAMFDGVLSFESGSFHLGRLALLRGDLELADTLLAEAHAHHVAIDAHSPNLRVALARADLARQRDDAAAIDTALADAERWAQRSGQRWSIERWVARHLS